MINASQASRLRKAFGPCTTVYECLTDAEIVNSVNGPPPKDENDWTNDGFGGDVIAWTETEIRVNEHSMGFNWNDSRSEAWNEKAKRDNEQWLAEVAANARKVAREIVAEIKAAA